MENLFAPPTKEEIVQRNKERYKNCKHEWVESTTWWLRPETYVKCYVRKRQCTTCYLEEVYTLEVDPWVNQTGDITGLQWKKRESA